MSSDNQGGGNRNLAADSLHAVAKQDKSLLSINIDASKEN